MRILHIIPSLNKGGAERLVADICNELQKRQDITVKLVVLHAANDYKNLTENIDLEVCDSYVSLSMSGRTYADINSLEKIISQFKPDIIHSHLFEAELVSRWKTHPSVKYFTHCHDNIRQFRLPKPAELIKKSSITEFYERKVLLRRYRNCNNHFIAISKHTETFLKSNLPSGLNNIHFLPNAINCSSFFSKNNIRAIGSTVRLINVGSFVENKNQIFLVDVVKTLTAKGLKVNLTLCGDGFNKAKTEQAAFDYGIQNEVFFPGKVENVQTFYSEADIYVHSALHEAFGLVLLEAMASGLPVICLNAGGNKDIIENGKNGFLIEKADPELFSEKIIELVKHPDLYKSTCEYAMDYAKRFDIGPYADNLLHLYQNG